MLPIQRLPAIGFGTLFLLLALIGPLTGQEATLLRPGQVFDGERVVDVTRKVYLIPFLVINQRSPAGPQPESFYWLAFPFNPVRPMKSKKRSNNCWIPIEIDSRLTLLSLLPSKERNQILTNF